MRKNHRTAHHLIGVPRVDPQADGHLDRLVELGASRLLYQSEGFRRLIETLPVDQLTCVDMLFAGHDQSTTSMPMLLAVPSIMRAAESMEVVFRSGSLVLAISLT